MSNSRRDSRTDGHISVRYAPGTIINNRWVLHERVGQGRHSEVYRALRVGANHKSKSVAIKMDKPHTHGNRRVMANEHRVLQDMQRSGLRCAAKFIEFWSPTSGDDDMFLVMELLGESISAYRTRQPNALFSSGKVSRIGVAMLDLLKQFHSLGYVHRDVKPSNFMRPANLGKKGFIFECFLIDFGLARRWRSPQGEVLNLNSKRPVEFRGTTKYASLNAHLGKDLTPRDDLFSLFFILVKFSIGRLPWEDSLRSEAQTLKEIMLRESHKLPEPLRDFVNHLKLLRQMDKPDYVFLASCIRRMRQESLARVEYQRTDCADMEIDSDDEMSFVPPPPPPEEFQPPPPPPLKEALRPPPPPPPSSSPSSSSIPPPPPLSQPTNWKPPLPPPPPRMSCGLSLPSLPSPHRSAVAPHQSAVTPHQSAVAPQSPIRPPSLQHVCLRLIEFSQCIDPVCQNRHPPSRRVNKAFTSSVSLCFEFIKTHTCRKGDHCSQYHWSSKEEEHFIASGILPQLHSQHLSTPPATLRPSSQISSSHWSSTPPSSSSSSIHNKQLKLNDIRDRFERHQQQQRENNTHCMTATESKPSLLSSVVVPESVEMRLIELQTIARSKGVKFDISRTRNDLVSLPIADAQFILDAILSFKNLSSIAHLSGHIHRKCKNFLATSSRSSSLAHLSTKHSRSIQSETKQSEIMNGATKSSSSPLSAGPVLDFLRKQDDSEIRKKELKQSAKDNDELTITPNDSSKSKPSLDNETKIDDIKTDENDSDSQTNSIKPVSSKRKYTRKQLSPSLSRRRTRSATASLCTSLDVSPSNNVQQNLSQSASKLFKKNEASKKSKSAVKASSRASRLSKRHLSLASECTDETSASPMKAQKINNISDSSSSSSSSSSLECVSAKRSTLPSLRVSVRTLSYLFDGVSTPDTSPTNSNNGDANGNAALCNGQRRFSRRLRKQAKQKT